MTLKIKVNIQNPILNTSSLITYLLRISMIKMIKNARVLELLLSVLLQKLKNRIQIYNMTHGVAHVRWQELCCLLPGT